MMGNKTEMGKVLELFGGASFIRTSKWKEAGFSKSLINMMIQDGVIFEYKRGPGKETFWTLTKKGQMIAELTK
jgi:hypothetical protein